MGSVLVAAAVKRRTIALTSLVIVTAAAACARGATAVSQAPSLSAPPAATTSTTAATASAPASAATAAAVPFDTAWHASPTGATPVLRQIAGVRTEPGPFRYYYRTPATTSLAAHRHTAAIRIQVLEGRQYILMGPDLETARAQSFAAGTAFDIPAGMWHVEWFEEDTLVEISGIGPMRTERATPTTPRRLSHAAGSGGGGGTPRP